MGVCVGWEESRRKTLSPESFLKPAWMGLPIPCAGDPGEEKVVLAWAPETERERKAHSGVVYWRTRQRVGVRAGEARQEGENPVRGGAVKWPPLP